MTIPSRPISWLYLDDHAIIADGFRVIQLEGMHLDAVEEALAFSDHDGGTVNRSTSTRPRSNRRRASWPLPCTATSLV
jgi:hypothetical protein